MKKQKKNIQQLTEKEELFLNDILNNSIEENLLVEQLKNVKSNEVPDIEVNVSDAIQEIEGWATEQRFKYLENFFYNRLEKISGDKVNDNEQQGTCYYYILRIKLKKQLLYETNELKDVYFKMLNFYKAQEKKLLDKIKNSEKNKIHRNVGKLQLLAFYRLMEFHFASIQTIYKHKDFIKASKRAYSQKMGFRQKKYKLKKNYLNYIGFRCWQLSCNYGDSLLRWALTIFLFLNIFGFLFYLNDLLFVPDSQMLGHGLLNYLYFSTTTITTLGIGDIVPVNAFGKVLVIIETLLGYTMFALFILLIQKRID